MVERVAMVSYSVMGHSVTARLLLSGLRVSEARFML